MKSFFENFKSALPAMLVTSGAKSSLVTAFLCFALTAASYAQDNSRPRYCRTFDYNTMEAWESPIFYFGDNDMVNYNLELQFERYMRAKTDGKEGSAGCQVAAGMKTPEETLQWLKNVKKQMEDQFIAKGGHITYLDWAPKREKPSPTQ